jgi:hypothetical protein
MLSRLNRKALEGLGLGGATLFGSALFHASRGFLCGLIKSSKVPEMKIPKPVGTIKISLKTGDEWKQFEAPVIDQRGNLSIIQGPRLNGASGEVEFTNGFQILVGTIYLMSFRELRDARKALETLISAFPEWPKADDQNRYEVWYSLTEQHKAAMRKARDENKAFVL